MRFVILALSLLLLSACSTALKDSLDSVSPGMDKADVLELNGSPWLTRRAYSKDMWVYRYYEGDQEYHRQLTFEHGKVVAIAPAQKHPSEKDQLQNADTMEQYKEVVEQKQSNFNKGFKDLETTADDD